MEFVKVFIVIMRDKRPCALHDDDQVNGTHPKHGASTHANTLTAKNKNSFTGNLAVGCTVSLSAEVGEVGGERTVDDVPNGFEASAADGPFVGVEFGGFLVEPD